MFFMLKRPTPLDQAEPGNDVILMGTARAKGRALTIPKTSIRCLYYDVLYEHFERGARGAGRKMWLPKSSEQAACDFTLSDGETSILVLMDGAEIKATGLINDRGPAGKRTRYSANYIPEGCLLKIAGHLESKKKSRRKKELVLVAGERRLLELRVKKPSA